MTPAAILLGSLICGFLTVITFALLRIERGVDLLVEAAESARRREEGR